MFKEINIESGQFVANGTTYYIVPEKITPYRFQIWQQMSLEMSFNLTFEKLYDTVKDIFNASTQGNDLLSANHKIAEMSYNCLRSVGDIRVNNDIYLKFCTLFINTEDEDLARWDDHVVSKKIEDWKSEPFDMNVFFSLAMNQVPGLIKKFNDSSSLKWQPIKQNEADF